jgi:hypothetical protein
MIYGLMVLLLVVFGAPNVYAYTYDTFYSPEKKFSIDYVESNTFPLNITETSDSVRIQTGPMDIGVIISDNPIYDDLSRESLLNQRMLQLSGHVLDKTTHPVVIDNNGNKTGYSFTTMYGIEDEGLTIIYDSIITQHYGKIYQIILQYDISHAVMAPDEIMQTVDSIKFFD